jgi:hypothetical protein
MKIARCCKNCEYSLWFAPKRDPEHKHWCDCITSGLIKNESACTEHGYKYFSKKEPYEEANHG